MTQPSWLYRSTLRAAAFAYSRDDPERAHDTVLGMLARLSAHPAALTALARGSGAHALTSTREVFGLSFRSPIGLAAGFDKNAVALPALAALGFGFVEAGGITAVAQPGHPRPRIWRYARDESLVNAMGFPNRGAAEVARRVRTLPRPGVPVGWNVAKSMSVDVADAAEDYCTTVTHLHDVADFFVANVSSPNTPGLRSLERRDALDSLLRPVVLTLDGLAQAAALPRRRPLLVKVSPEVDDEMLDDIVTVVLDRGIDGVVATNTSVRRDRLRWAAPVDRGGLSGRALHHLSVDVVTALATRLDGRVPIVGVGGISTPDTAQRMFDAGATLVQLYTSLIFDGPGVVRRLNRAFAADWVRG